MSVSRSVSVSSSVSVSVSVFICDLCAEKSLADHVRGRGHQTQLDRRREALCNVFVRGFPKHTLLTVDLVSRLFQQYGPVTNVFVKVCVLVMYITTGHVTWPFRMCLLLSPLLMKPVQQQH